MKSLNKVQLIGYVGKDAEVRYTAAGVAVGEFSMATSEKWKDKTSGEDKERTEWHTVAAWAKLGELVGEYVKKGLPVYVEGTIRTDKYEKDGQTHYRTKIQATNIIFLREKQTEAPARQTPKQGMPVAKPEDDDFDDQVPF
jgi:single-strand DNA-binding protein